ncbi:MAG: hypothetical protein A3B89_02225 [Candidatus Buchananbacteria bacterium RIFCSPHIGHO2_02_FULL_40_13]|uniref:Peptidase S11 D-alanyl-D-alanine carboxypeptidase A N-terminal domain-containing protein n=1 Tax=Candidatus Buchananbacteria bacterium RIFCSPLOWO2_01_FULL_39_33 TaxID=1797543 RepID=A0A1G1YL43_9BACT|nr:MAG: hypothetical protein A2820_02855 [Candidatus Buchananbacteria bacterium RIFCSPHIGHO2_01_FULL_40_35]OGY50597.1 MAG: hypothetical protein A3B89_02225 [Candidatus Buchananbacteria bacterium RIFCSPHIGHO2_02_FULL_40_13]OGY53068.1 MAG: hypothetical protein A3A02_03105 [Candidatus Buchananbacteria bacterium RIFCSPLOWO2_01_FULL_39_33]
MFELLVNLILTSLFLQAQAQEQLTVKGLTSIEYRLPQAEIKKLQQTAPQKYNNSGSLGVAVSAQSVLVADEKTGKVLYEKNSQEIRTIASLTKLMTALVFLDHNPGWSSEIKILEADYHDGGISYLIAGELVSVRDLFYASLVSSSNEATAALARSTGLNNADFVKAMNRKAEQLGLVSTFFADVTGLSNDNKSTAADLAIMSQVAFLNSDINQAASLETYDLNIINKGLIRNIKSTDKILNQAFGLADKIYQVEAGKTGYLEAAGYNFASRVSDNSDRKILVVVLGSETALSRFADTKSLAYWVFNNYQW